MREDQATMTSKVLAGHRCYEPALARRLHRKATEQSVGRGTFDMCSSMFEPLAALRVRSSRHRRPQVMPPVLRTMPPPLLFSKCCCWREGRSYSRNFLRGLCSLARELNAARWWVFFREAMGAPREQSFPADLEIARRCGWRQDGSYYLRS